MPTKYIKTNNPNCKKLGLLFIKSPTFTLRSYTKCSYSFGSLIPGLTGNSPVYRYGFQGQEKDDELKGEGNSLNYTFRMHDPRVGRFFAIDPLTKKYPHYSPYSFSGNKVIHMVELEGLEEAQPAFKKGNLPKPVFHYDSGFSKMKKNRAESVWDEFLYAGAILGAEVTSHTSLEDGAAAYKHYFDGGGKDFKFNLGKYFKEDTSGQIALFEISQMAKGEALKILPIEGNTTMTSRGFSAGKGVDFPYPDTQNWQKAIGAFNLYARANVTAVKDNKGNLNYTMKLTVFGEDVYNFNPGAKDIFSGLDDDVSGGFEVRGLANQFFQTGTYTKIYTWQVSKEEVKKAEALKKEEATKKAQTAKKTKNKT